MTFRKRTVIWVVVVVVFLAVGAIAVSEFYDFSPFLANSTPGEITQKMFWRVQVYERKAKGDLGELSWNELWQMSRRQGGFGLESIVRDRLSVDGAVQNSFVTQKDYDTGAGLFRAHCAVCHGSEGTGGHGPALNRADLRHGSSDLAIYKVLRDGIAGTAMVPPPLSFAQRWQIVGFLRTLQLQKLGSITKDAVAENIDVTNEDLLGAGKKTDEWLTYSGSRDGHRYTPLSEVTPANVSQLRLRWVQQFDSVEPVIEATPLVVGGTMFITEPPSNVVAVDVRSGKVIWRYKRNVSADVPVCCGRVNRGVAVLGNVLYLESLDGYLVALDANRGKVKWEIQVVKFSDGYALTAAPLIVNHSVVVGVAGGEFGIRGFLAAYDPETGQQQWKFFTVPGPGEPGHETWQTDAWQTGGAPTWTAGSYDPALDLIYWGAGNPSPDFAGDVRPGDNLYSNSVIALHASTGKLAWYFQFTPHDEYDWDSAQTPILADLPIKGTTRKVLCWANRNGFYYVLDRATGEFLAGTPFVSVTWTKGLDSKGRPIPDPSKAPNSEQLIHPGIAGGTNWQNSAYDEKRGLIFIPATEGVSVFTKQAHPERGDRGFFVGSAGSQPEPDLTVVRAIDPATGARKWEYLSPPLKDISFSYSGLLATGGGLVFGASGGTAFAVDSATGKELWRAALGGDTRAAPISFTVDGRQVIAVSSGRAVFLFGLEPLPAATTTPGDALHPAATSGVQ